MPLLSSISIESTHFILADTWFIIIYYYAEQLNTHVSLTAYLAVFNYFDRVTKGPPSVVSLIFIKINITFTASYYLLIIIIVIIVINIIIISYGQHISQTANVAYPVVITRQNMVVMVQPRNMLSWMIK